MRRRRRRRACARARGPLSLNTTPRPTPHPSRRLRNQRNRHYHCSSRHTVEDDIISQRYLDALALLGAEVRIIEEIPNTIYTSMIPGGRATFWGMSFNKLRIFAMTEFRKILFIDADVLIMRNIDHVLLEPDFTAAFTTECCNAGARGKLGGGMWVFEPSAARWNYTMELIKMPCPDSELGTWVHADMDVVNYMFCDIREGESFESWPFTRDLRQGVLPGIKYIPQYRDVSEGDYARLTGFPTSGLQAPEGLLPMHANKRGIWHILDTRFDSLVGNCECQENRDMHDVAFTVHFSCMAIFSKPGHFGSDADFLGTVYSRGKSCSRFYYMTWYDKFSRAMAVRGGVGGWGRSRARLTRSRRTAAHRSPLPRAHLPGTALSARAPRAVLHGATRPSAQCDARRARRGVEARAARARAQGERWVRVARAPRRLRLRNCFERGGGRVVVMLAPSGPLAPLTRAHCRLAVAAHCLATVACVVPAA